MLIRKMVLGSIIIVLAYVFWFAYIAVLKNDSFFYYPWIDIPFHIIGGLVLGLFFMLVQIIRRPELTIDKMAGPAIGWTMIIGAVWEMYEYIFKLNKTEANIYVDTASDMINDLVGSILAVGVVWLIYKFIKKRPH